MSERLKFKRVRRGLWRHRTYLVEKAGAKWNVRKGKAGEVVCEGAKNLTAASACIIADRSK
jgi:hypothetical protein